MKRTAKYVGLDVHQATTVASVRDTSGRVIARTILPAEGAALVEFLRGMRGTVRVAFEEGTRAQWLHDLLVPVADGVIVCDRRGERRRRGNKADQVDADDLSHRLRSGDLRAVYHGSSDRRLLHELTRTYVNVVEDATRTMQRLKALFRARAVRASGERVYAPGYRQQWLARLEDRGARFRAEVLFAELDLLRELRRERLTLARKFAALTLRLWKTGEACDPKKLMTHAT
jgi:transposase